MQNTPSDPLVYSVSRLNTEVRQILESSFPLIWVEGEISNLSTPRSGHLYFSLKDAWAQTRCAMFRMKRQYLRFQPVDGMKVRIRARITLYETRGDFQLVVEHMEIAGEGQLRQAIEQLKNKLQAEGLFNPSHKKPLPALPKTVGVITSPSGAVIQDILNVFKRRFPGIRIIVYPVAVQGENAAREITHMLKLADQRQECDLLILARGGGSLEDLMAFNDEAMARTIFALNTPVISAVGHEVDSSISDFVADRRAPTPSAAAELASPDQIHLQQNLDKLSSRLQQSMRSVLEKSGLTLNNLQQRMQHQSPGQQLQSRFQTLDYLEQRLQQSLYQQLQERKNDFDKLQQRLAFQSPEKQLEKLSGHFQQWYQRLLQQHPTPAIKQHKLMLDSLQARLEKNINDTLEKHAKRLQNQAALLQTVSPLATLSRGYAVVKTANGKLVTTITAVTTGEPVSVQLADGTLACHIDEIQ